MAPPLQPDAFYQHFAGVSEFCALLRIFPFVNSHHGLQGLLLDFVIDDRGEGILIFIDAVSLSELLSVCLSVSPRVQLR